MASTTGSTMANITVTTERKSKRRCKQEGGRIMYKKKYSGWLKHADFLILDIIVLQLSFYVAYCIRHGIGNMYANQLYAGMAIVLLLVDIVIGIVFENLHNVMKRGYWIEAIQTSKQVLEVFALFAIYLITVQSAEQFSRTVLYLTMVFYWILSYVGRTLWKTYLKHHNRYAAKRSLIIVTKADRLGTLTEQLQGETYAAYQILGITVVDADMMGQQIGNYTVIANADSIIEYTRTGWVDEIYIDLEPGDASAEPLVRQFLEMGTVMHVRVPDALTESGRKIIMEKLGDMPVITATMNYASPRQLFMKRCLDVTGGLIGCILTGILCIFLAPAIYIQSPGPIFFSQIRVGKNGKQFRLYKFRSMYMDAEERKAELMKQNKMSDGKMFKMDNDPRIIGSKILPDGTYKKGIGNFIRDFSIDEFPQFFNVLKGDISLVGTRPPLVSEVEQYELRHCTRLAMKPGITGMWQISGRSSITDFDEVVKLDQEYIENWNFGKDLKILVKTVGAVLKKDGAV